MKIPKTVVFPLKKIYFTKKLVIELILRLIIGVILNSDEILEDWDGLNLNIEVTVFEWLNQRIQTLIYFVKVIFLGTFITTRHALISRLLGGAPFLLFLLPESTNYLLHDSIIACPRHSLTDHFVIFFDVLGLNSLEIVEKWLGFLVRRGMFWVRWLTFLWIQNALLRFFLSVWFNLATINSLIYEFFLKLLKKARINWCEVLIVYLPVDLVSGFEVVEV